MKCSRNPIVLVSLVSLAAAALLGVVSGCAGGWRHGAPAGAGSTSSPAAAPSSAARDTTQPGAAPAPPPAAGGTPSPSAAPPAPASGNPATATPAAGTARPPVVSADGVTFTFAGNASSVSLAGDFNNWSTTADPMVKQPDGTWAVTKKLAPGSYAYKFVVNGSTWKQDVANPQSKDDGFGGKSSVVTVQP